MYAILGGVHRAKAKAKLGAVVTLALVVVTDSATAEAVAGRLNAVMGRRTTEAERVTQAIELIRKRGWRITDAASYLSLPSSKVSVAMRVTETREFLESKGVSATATKGVATEKMLRVAGIESKPLKLAVAEFAVAGAAKMATPEFRRVVDAVLKMDIPESERIAIIGQETEKCKRKRATPKSMGSGAANELRAAIRRLTTVADKYPTRTAGNLDSADSFELTKLWVACCEKISTTLNG
jgi:hypothetical protein